MSQNFEFTEINWNRRQFLKAGAALLVSSSLLSLIGCGGSGGGSGVGANLVNFSGTVALPPGLDPSTLIVGAGLGTGALTNGKFAARAPGDAPSIVTVFDPLTKKVVLMGLTNPGSGTVVIDATSTAVALIFFAVGGSSMSRNGMKNLVDAIRAHPATATLAGVISARILVDPFAVGNGDSQIVSALSVAANAFASGHSFPRTPAEIAGGSGVPTLLELNPTGMVNGITFLNLSNITGYAVQNTKRRMGYVYTYLTAHVNPNDIQTPVDPPSQVGEVVEVPATTSLLNGNGGWAPISSAQVPLEIQGDDSKSIYEMVYLTQVYGEPEPAFFSEGRWAQEVVKWRASLNDLGKDTFVGFFANIILSAVGFAGLAWEHATLATLIADLQAIPSISVLIDSAVGSQVLLGDLARATINEFLASDLVSASVLSDMAALVGELSAEAAAYLAASAGTAIGLAAVQAAVGALLVCGAVLLSGDLGAIALDTSFGDRGTMGTGTVIRQKLLLTPQNPTAQPGDRIAFSVKLPAGTQGQVEYDWTCDALFAVLSSADGHSGHSITTPRKNVDLVTTGSDQGVITVKVTAFIVSGGGRTEVGSAQSRVTLEGGGGGGGDLGVVTITVSGDPFGGDGVYVDRDVQGGQNGDSFAMQSTNGEFPFVLGIATLDGHIDGTYPLGNPSNPPCFSFRGLIHHVTNSDFCTASSTIVNGHTRVQFSFQASKDLGGGFVVTYSGSGTCRMNNF